MRKILFVIISIASLIFAYCFKDNLWGYIFLAISFLSILIFISLIYEETKYPYLHYSKIELKYFFTYKYMHLYIKDVINVKYKSNYNIYVFNVFIMILGGYLSFGTGLLIENENNENNIQIIVNFIISIFCVAIVFAIIISILNKFDYKSYLENSCKNTKNEKMLISLEFYYSILVEIKPMFEMLTLTEIQINSLKDKISYGYNFGIIDLNQVNELNEKLSEVQTKHN